MDRHEKQVREILKQHEAVIDRQRKHEVWRFPNNAIFVVPSTLSDVRGWKNALMNLQRLLGLFGERGAEGARREKRRTQTRPTTSYSASVSVDVKIPTLREALLPIRPSTIQTIKHPVHGSRCRQAVSAPPVDLSGLARLNSPR